MLVRSPLLTSHKWRELFSSGRLVCRCHDVFLWCYLCFVLVRFRLYAFDEAAALRSMILRPMVLRYNMRAPRYPHVFLSSSFFPLIYLEMSLFPSIFCTIIAVFSLYGEYVVRSFLPNIVFCLVTTGWIFDISLCENSINSINLSAAQDAI